MSDNIDFKVEEEKLLNEDVHQFPSAFTQARNLMKQAWLSGTDVFKGKSLMASIEKANSRLDICKTCEYFVSPRCIQCGCYMDKKVHLESAQCPLNKWGDLQVLLAKVENRIPSNHVDITSFSEQDQIGIKMAASQVKEPNKPFWYNGKYYISRKLDNGEDQIFNYDAQKPNTGLPNFKPRNQIDTFTPEQKTEFFRLAEEAKLTESKTFTYFGATFNVVVDGGKNIIKRV